MSSTRCPTDRLLEAVAERAGSELARITPDTALEADLGMSSLDRLDLLAWVEDEFCVEIPDERLAELTTPRRIMNAVRAIRRDRSEIAS